MRITSVMPQRFQPANFKNGQINNTQTSQHTSYTNSLELTVNPAMLVPFAPIQRGGGVYLTFTGSEKNINQFMSYAPENKRYGLTSYLLGGLGVVAQEGPDNWRLHERADVRDFSPYHSYDNTEGGIKVVELIKDKSGNLKRKLNIQHFHKAGQNESLEDVAKRLGKGLTAENLAYVIQIAPNEKAESEFVILKDEGISGSFKRVSDNAIDKLKKVTYRLFSAPEFEDPVVVAEKKLEQKIKKQVSEPYIKKIKEALEAEHHYEKTLKKLNDEDEARFKADQFSFEPNPKIEEIETAYNKQIEEELKKVKDNIDKDFHKAITKDEYKKELKKIKENVAPAVNERNRVYFVHTEDLARFENAYGVNQKAGSAYGAYGAYGAYATEGSADGLHHVSTNTFYTDNGRALIEILPQMDNEAHGNYNPANYWLHDRPAFMIMNQLADKSAAGVDYYNGGVKAHSTFHNPGRDYQGWSENPFEFFRNIASEDDVKELRNHPQIKELKYIEKNWDKFGPRAGQELSPEAKFAKQILDPFLENFRDDFGTYNLSMGPVAAVKTNPKNATAGTVSVNYGKEMRNPDTPEIALGMGGKIREIETHDITNGSTPANLQIENPKAGFSQRNNMNILTKLKRGFQNYKYEFELDKNNNVITDNIDEVLKAKENNTKWLLDIVDHAYQKGGQNGVAKVFCSDRQIGNGATVLGHLSGFKKGDKLFIGWGRPDPQKNLPASVGAIKEYLEFLKDKNIPDEVKLRTKGLFGAGIWDANADEYKWIKHIIEEELPKIDNGKYIGNLMYVNNWFSNRLVGCASFTLFSSRFEPCGITPLESFASATPCISINTGGSPDFINELRGFLTKNPYLLKRERLEEILGQKLEFNGDAGHDAKILDGARWKNACFELKDCIVMAMQSSDEEFAKTIQSQLSEELKKQKIQDYKSMVQNAGQQRNKMDWHQNADYNGGRTANELYMNDVFERNKGIEARNKHPMKRLAGKFGVATEKIIVKAEETLHSASSSRIGKIIAFSALGAITVATGGYYLYKRRQKKLGYDKPVEQKTFTKVG